MGRCVGPRASLARRIDEMRMKCYVAVQKAIEHFLLEMAFSLGESFKARNETLGSARTTTQHTLSLLPHGRRP
jgi:hypothetical protein